MTDINQLSSTDPQLSDLVPFFSGANSDARKATISKILALLTSSSSDQTVTQYWAPNATGLTQAITAPSSSTFLLITPTSAFAAETILLPLAQTCVDKQMLTVTTTQAITTLTVSGNGAVVNGAPATLAANGFFRLRFDGVFRAWYRVG